MKVLLASMMAEVSEYHGGFHHLHFHLMQAEVSDLMYFHALYSTNRQVSLLRVYLQSCILEGEKILTIQEF